MVYLSWQIGNNYMRKSQDLNIQELLNLRTEFENITQSFSMVDSGSSINILEWFVKDGHKSNSLRKNYDRAKEIATIILGEVTDGSKKIRKGF